MILLDAEPLIALVLGESGSGQTRDLIKEGGDGAAITAVNLAEVTDVLERRYGVDLDRQEGTLRALLEGYVHVVNVTDETGWHAGRLRAKYLDPDRRSVSMADCILIRVAVETGATAVTRDAEMLRICEQVGVKTATLRS